LSAHPIAAQLGAKVRERRMARGFSRRALAQMAGVSEGILGRIEDGRAALDVDVLAKLAEPLGLELWIELLEHSDHREPFLAALPKLYDDDLRHLLVLAQAMLGPPQDTLAEIQVLAALRRLLFSAPRIMQRSLSAADETLMRAALARIDDETKPK
jgi:transcriptional regulator with XRE-family HTH domain